VCHPHGQATCRIRSWSFPEDSPGKHREDTLVSGCFINDRALVDVFVNQAASVIEELEAMGMLFEREPSGKTFFSGGQPPGHSYPRSLTYKETTGKMIVDALRRQASERDPTDLRSAGDPSPHSEWTDPGVLLWNIAGGEIEEIQCEALILATGGCGQLYPMTSNPEQSTGDGYILGYEAGLELVDMEMFQFYPVSLVCPKFLRGSTSISVAAY